MLLGWSQLAVYHEKKDVLNINYNKNEQCFHFSIHFQILNMVRNVIDLI